MCQSATRCLGNEVGRCQGCLSVWYCSIRCRSVDWPAHQLLCSSYLLFLGSRPSSLHKLAIWFPRDSERPTLVWVSVPVARSQPASGGSGKELVDRQGAPDLDPFLGTELPGRLCALPVTRNNRRGVDVGHEIRVYHRGDGLANRSLCYAVEACHGMTVPGAASGGPLVAMATRKTINSLPPEIVDMTLSDFRHVLDLFSTRGDSTVRETPTGGAIRALRISCELEQKLYGRDVFSPVFVQADLPFEHEQSPLCCMLGDAPLVVCRPLQTHLELRCADLLELESTQASSRGLHNTYATALTTIMDRSSPGWGMPPKPWEGGAIVARSDRADLDIGWATRVCRYCVEVLQPLFRKARAGEMKRKAAVREATPGKLATFPSNP